MKLFNYWRSSASYRVRIALHHKQLPFDYLPVDLLAGEQHGEAHRGRNPWGGVPCLEVEEEGRTLQLSQSVAIIEYLEERYPERPLLPRSPAGRAQARMLAELVNSGIQPLQNLGVLRRVKDELGGDSTAWAAWYIDQGLESLEQLAKRSAGTFLVGDAVTVADCFLVPQLFASRRFHVDLSRYPTLLRVEETCQRLPAFQQAHPNVQPDARPA